jgi:sugar transferase (PEP-CTERM/EpsH1 system associated)
MSDILFLAQRIPYPPVKGDKIRSANILKHLAARHRVFCGAFVDDPEDWRQVGTLQSWCADLCLVQLDRRPALCRSLGGLATGEALCLPYYRDSRLKAWVSQILCTQRPSCAYVFSSAMAQYVVNHPQRPDLIIMDFVDVDSQKWQAYADGKSWPLSWVYRREARLLLKHDRAVAARTTAGLFVSPAEAALFRQLAPEVADRIVSVANGVDTAYFDPSQDFPNPFRSNATHVVFTGAMDYWPNVEAVTWFADTVLPLLRRFHPIEFVIVGSNPGATVTALGERDGIQVTGRVPDIRPYLAHAHAVVAPLNIARGVQNKVLEAMAMARPVVVTPQALEGIAARPGHEVLEAPRQPEHFAATLLDALSPDHCGLGVAARRLVCRDYSWPGTLAMLDGLLA